MNEQFENKSKSSFVTVISWVFIVIAGFGSLMTLMQNIMIYTVFPMAEINEAMKHQDDFKDMPFFIKFMFEHIQVYFTFIFLLTLTTFISAIGLLKRQNWARRIFIFIMAFAILFVLGGFAMQLTMFSPSSMGMPQEQMPPEFSTMMNLVKIFTFIFTVGIAVLCGWIIKKLVSKDIAEEFNQMKNFA